MHRQKRSAPATAIIAASSLMLQSSMPLVAALDQTKPPAQGAGAATPAPAAAADPAIVDGGWPRVYTLAGGGSILVYQPQIASWANQKHIVAFSAVSYRGSANASAKPALGTIRLITAISIIEL